MAVIGNGRGYTDNISPYRSSHQAGGQLWAWSTGQGKTGYLNSFALATPAGELAGCTRKTVSETYCFRYGNGRHRITTGISQIGVGICADNHLHNVSLPPTYCRRTG